MYDAIKPTFANKSYYAPPHREEALNDDARLTSVCLTSEVCLSVAYIGSKSRTERPRKTKIGTEVGHVTHDSDTTFKVNLQGAGACGGIPRSLLEIVTVFIKWRELLCPDPNGRRH